MTEAPKTFAMPGLRTIGFADVLGSLRAGLRDFLRAPTFGLFFGAVFSVIGIVIFLQLVVWESTYWVLPIGVGFPLIGPFVAIGLYEVSRRIAAGEPLDWAQILTVPLHSKARQIPSIAFVAVFFFLVWVYMAHLIFALSFGLKPLTNVMTSTDLLFTTEGVVMLVAGSAVGAGLAFLLFAVTVVSVPMMLDRDIDVVSAMVTSFRAVLLNKAPMLLWGGIIAALSMVAMLPMFLGMIVVFPVLGHASWHLYARTVIPSGG